MLVSCMGTAREVQSNNACQPTHARQPLNAGGRTLALWQIVTPSLPLKRCVRLRHLPPPQPVHTSLTSLAAHNGPSLRHAPHGAPGVEGSPGLPCRAARLTQLDKAAWVGWGGVARPGGLQRRKLTRDEPASPSQLQYWEATHVSNAG